jgi:hypothetical protein
VSRPHRTHLSCRHRSIGWFHCKSLHKVGTGRSDAKICLSGFLDCSSLSICLPKVSRSQETLSSLSSTKLALQRKMPKHCCALRNEAHAYLEINKSSYFMISGRSNAG